MRPLERFFYVYGDFITRHPWPFIIVPLTLTIISSYGMLWFHSQDDIWDIYAPLNALSRVEEKGLLPFEYASASHHYRMQILVTRKDHSNLLTNEALDELYDIQKFITENMTASNGIQTFNYTAICGVYCQDNNGVIIAFLRTALATRGTSMSIRLSFPNAEAFQKRVFLGYSLGDLTFYDDQPDEIREARLLILHFMVDTSLPNGKRLAADFESKLRRVFAALSESSNDFLFSLLSREREIEEQRKITITSIPYLGVTVIVLVLFMFLTLIDFPLYRSQYMESLVGIISPAMALWTSCGVLFWIGFPFTNILTVVPFLVVTIGVDDAFLLLAGWRQSTKGAPLEQRMAESVSISGASITVTSITDVFCFAIGLFSNLPVVRLFCLFTTAALFVDFVYQLTFFTAVMSFIVRRQHNFDQKVNKHKVQNKASPAGRCNGGAVFSITIPGFSIPVTKKTSTQTRLEIFVDWLHSKTAKSLIMLVFLTHIVISACLASQVNTDFDMENLYLEESPLTDISRRMQDFVLRESFVVNFAVQPMPDFTNETVRMEFEEMVEKLERIPNFGAGPNSTVLWTRDYSSDIAFWDGDEDFWTPDVLLKNYYDYGLEEKFITIKKNKNGEDVIDGFYFVIVYRNMSSFLDVQHLMEQRRAIIASYPLFHVLSHHPFEKVPTESAASAPYNFLQTAVSAVVLMSVVVLLFVMNWEAIISVVISITSICLGIVAYLHLWGVRLDAVSLISILMSVGFSVDYSAHVCYHYFAHANEHKHEHTEHTVSTTDSFRSGSTNHSMNSSTSSQSSMKEQSMQRVLRTLRGVGWPVIQSGLSTIIGLFPLIFVQAYVVAVFWKTVFLVGALGMFHALLLLPTIFLLTDELKKFFKRTRL
ncbi:hypothetical protein KIN20_033303 [Parelaphostrongylus tenuis]|uniref:SSD domain-containing protein n=1 Tax=Parelaphostrongylus tenuis TaxID=148309 RepID=A0AAD5WIN9_PARTN|nr:hypothetical protein KIN20_033303 [Parelaphostrongylus tenuis]